MTTNRAVRSGLVLSLRIVIAVAAVVVAVVRFAMIDADSHSASDTLRPWLIEVVVLAVAAALVVVVIGRIAGRRRED